MSSDRDEHIRKLVARAEQEREREKSRSSATRTRSDASSKGKNGRQSVQKHSEASTVTKPILRKTSTQTKREIESKTATSSRSVQNANPAKTQAAKTASPPKAKQDSEVHIWISLMLFFIAGYLALCCISYMIYWQQDADLATWSHFFDFSASTKAANWGGRVGAIASQAIIGQWVGVMGLLFPVVFGIAAIKMLKIKGMPLRKGIRSTLIIIFTGSITLGHFAGFDAEVFGSGYGGQSGIYIAQQLTQSIGYEGTTLLVIFGSLGILYFTNSAWLKSIYRSIAAAMARAKQRKLAAAAARAATAAARTLSTAMAADRYDNVKQVAEPIYIEPAPIVAAAVVADIEQKTPAAEPVQDELEKEEIAPTMPEPSRLIRLQGDLWGYIIDWEVSGAPIYIYLESSALPEMEVVEKPAKFVQATPSEKSEDVDNEQVEFTVKFSEPQVEPATVAEIPAAAEVAPKKAAEVPTTIRFAPSKDDPNFIVEQTLDEDKLDDRSINLSQLYDPTAELSSYKKPPVELLHDHTRKVSVSEEELVENKNRIVHTLSTFGIKIDTIEATIGPTVTLYEIIPAPGVRISKIKNLEDDIALSLSALGIRIIAPIPGKGTIGIEVPNKEKETVSMYSVIRATKFQESKAELPIALGKTIQNETFVLDLAKMPHLLVAGATGQGKSVGLNAIITSLLYKKHPSELKFILIDPKKVELTLYAKLEKHFLAKMPAEEEAIITDTQKVIYTLNSICVEMDARYDLLKAAKVRNIAEYNDKFTHRRLNPEKGHRFLPYFVVIIDEFADLIMTAGREVETPIARIAQLARAVGIHMVIATQRPTTNIITGVIKANFPARIAFRVTSMIDSRTILDSPGANQLVGRGDMLVSTGTEVTRVQCAFIDTPEVDDITEYISNQRGYTSAYELPEYVPESEQTEMSREMDSAKRDPLFEEVARFVVANQSGSASTIQRKYSIGFNRAGRIIDQLEATGIVGRADGSKARQVLIQDPVSLEILLDV